MSGPASEKKNENQTSSNELKEKIIILIDLDDTLVDTTGALQRALFEKFGITKKELDFHQRTTFDYPPNYTHSIFPDVSLDVNQTIRDLMATRNFFRDAPEIPGAVAKVRELMAHPDCDVYFCTAPLRDIPSADPKIAWLVERFGPEARKRTFVCTKKSMIYGDVLLDDRMQENEGAFWLQVFYPQAWNAHVSEAKYMPAWTSLEVPQFVEKLKEWVSGSRQKTRKLIADTIVSEWFKSHKV